MRLRSRAGIRQVSSQHRKIANENETRSQKCDLASLLRISDDFDSATGGKNSVTPTTDYAEAPAFLDPSPEECDLSI